MSELLNNLLREIEDGYQYHGDGTATNKETGETVLVGLDGNAGTEDDNRIVNPAGTVLMENVNISCDADGEKFIALGNGFKLYGGDDGLLGTKDDIVKGFGTYQQGLTDEETTVQRQEPLDWYLLDLKDGKAILLSSKLIDGIQFNLEATDGNDWANSNLRSWLNSEGGVSASGNEEGFYDTAFSEAEKEKILLTEVKMNSEDSFIAYNRTKESDWWESYTTVGESTSDYVWVLSGEEAFQYFGLSELATYDELGHDPANYTNGYFIPTTFAYEEAGVKVNNGGNGLSFVGFGDSWTRSPGRDVDEEGNYYGVFWGSVGSLNSGRIVDSMYGVLPAITVDLGQGDLDWTYLGDGTAKNKEGEVVLVGLDGVAGSKDDNVIVNPAGTVLMENVVLSYEENGEVYVDLGNGFKLYGGKDGLLGTQDDAVENFGSYPQSDENGEIYEPLSWLLLDLQEEEATLISTTVLDAISFQLDKQAGNDWANSNLRSWLNSRGGVSNGGDTVGFYDRAFTDEEKAKINLSEVRCDYTDWEKWTKDGDDYHYQDMTGNFPGYDRTIEMYGLYTTTGENTMDYVYAISGEEVFEYFATSTIMNPEFYDLVNFTNGYFPTTPYAISQGAKFNSSALQWMFNNNADSWTRSQGRANDEEGNFYGTFWGSYGNMNTGRIVDAVYGILPMIRVNVAA